MTRPLAGRRADTVTWRRDSTASSPAGRTVAAMRAKTTAPIDAGALGRLLAADAVEGDAAPHVGVLGQFFDDLCETAEALLRPRRASAWRDRLTALLDTFFRSTESSFQAIAEIRRAIRTAGDAAAIAGDPTIPGDVIAAAVEAELGGMAAAGNCAANAVLFAAQTPRPRPAGRRDDGPQRRRLPASDTARTSTARHPRPGDRRRRQRPAFLEALMRRDRPSSPTPAATSRTTPDSAVAGRRGALQRFGDRNETTSIAVRLPSRHFRGRRSCPRRTTPPRRAAPRTGATSSALRGDRAADAGQLDDEARQSRQRRSAWFANPAQSFYTQIL